MKNMPTVKQFYSDTKAKSFINRAEGKVFYPKAVSAIEGNVSNTQAILSDDDTFVTIDSYTNSKPYFVFDMGKSSVGGYAVFRVTSVSKKVTLRLAFSNWFDHIVSEEFGELGEYKRNTCRYLGVELPILPADPHRFELFTVSQPGIYFFPLLQGQLRWVRMQLDTPDAQIEIAEFRVENHDNLDNSELRGYFECDVEDYNKVWHSGVWTAQLASIPNNDAWVQICGYMAPRYIETADLIGFLKDFHSTEYTFSFVGRISCNPSTNSALGFAIDVQDGMNAIVGKLSLDGSFTLIQMSNGESSILYEKEKIPVNIDDNVDFRVEIFVRNSNVRICIDGNCICDAKNMRLSGGTVGFYAEKEMWFAVREVLVNGENKDKLSFWNYRKTLGYLSDGAMRDRLLWTGDITFASRNIYYAVNPQYIRSSIHMMMQNQTEEGYVNPSPYPGNIMKPQNDDYGPFPSSQFSAWFTPIVAEYVAYTGDVETAKNSFHAVKKNLEFVYRDIDKEDGIFETIPELSKTIGEFKLGKRSKNSFTNVIVFLTFKSGAYLADLLGETEEAAKWRHAAENLKIAIMEHLFDNERPTIIGSIGDNSTCQFANSLAVMSGMFDKKIASKLPFDCEGAGKLLGLNIRAMFECDRDGEALNRIKNGSKNVNWIGAQNDWRHPATVSECMHYPELPAYGANWNDKSHPDSAISDILSSYLLGVKIADTAFKRLDIAPHFLDATKVRGIVPTPHGEVKFAWELSNDEDCTWNAYLAVCEGIVTDMRIPITGSNFTILIEGQPIDKFETEQTEDFFYVRNIPSGEYEIRTKSCGEFYEKYIKELEKCVETKDNTAYIEFSVNDVSSCIEQDTLLWHSCPEDIEPWIELDMGEEHMVARMRLHFARVKKGTLKKINITIYDEKRERGETISFEEMQIGENGIIEADLFTVLGFMKGRYIRITVLDNDGVGDKEVMLSDIKIQ